MKLKKHDIVAGIILGVLIVVVGCIALIINGNKTKDIRKAKAFLEELYTNDMVVKTSDIASMDFQRAETNKKQGDNKFTTISTQDFGVDLDGDYNIIGFSNKGVALGEIKISKEESKDIAERYLYEIDPGEHLFKDFIETDKKEGVPYYTLAFSKCKNGYPYYFDEVTISIDKTTGKLDGYTNVITQGEAKKAVINKNKDESKEIALSKFNEINKLGKVDENVKIAYGLKLEKESKSELCYVVSIKGKDDDNKDISYNYFVSTETGEVVDSYRNLVKETKSVK